MQFTVTWFNPTKNLYDNFYIPENYLTEYKCRFTDNFNYSNYIDTKASLSQVHNYFNGYGLVDDIFDDEVANWIRSSSNIVDFKKYKNIVDKIQIY